MWRSLLFVDPAITGLRLIGSPFSVDKEKSHGKRFHSHFRRQDKPWMAEFSGDDQEQKNTAGVGNSPEEALKDLFLAKDKTDYQTEVREQKK